MGYTSQGTERLGHSLFVGIKREKQDLNKYKINASSFDEKYLCNFDVLDQEIIIQNLLHVKNGPWIRELHNLDIHIQDNGMVKGSIEILIGADITGKLFAGRIHRLNCGLTVIETKLDWTLTGKVDPEVSISMTKIGVCSMFAQDGKIASLWELDVLRIRDTIEQKTKLEKENWIKEQFF